MRRPTYQQILDWNARRGGHRRLGIELIGQIDALQADAIARHAPVHLQFVPIRLVTILEVFLREVIAELVDGDEVIFERAEKLVRGTKIDLAFAAYVDGHELTIGDFVAHAVSLNGTAGIMSVMDTLIEGFARRLRVVHSRWSEDAERYPLPPIVADLDATMAALTRLFEVRHVLTHEIPSENVLDPSELAGFFDAAQTFVEATDWLVVEVLRGTVPRTQIAMNMHAGNDLRGEEERLETIVSQVAALQGIDGEALREMQTVWTEFADRHAGLVASQVEGGSMYPLLWAGEKAALVRERITQLERIAKGWMD